MHNARIRTLASARVASAFLVTALATAFAAADTLSPIAGSLRYQNLSLSSQTPASATEHVTMAVSLAPRDLAGLQQYAQQVSDPSSIYYRQFISPQEVGLRFGPSQDDITNATNYLAGNGLQIDSVSNSGLVIMVEGTVQQVQTAFHTKVSYVNFNDGSGSFRTNMSTLTVPSSIASKIVSVDGIDTSMKMQKRATTTTINPTSYRSAFGGNSFYGRYMGQGMNVGIANWDGYRLNNIPLWCAAWHLPTPTSGAGTNIHIREVGTGATYGQGSPGGEGDLDLQAVLMAAPLANVYDYDDATSDNAAPISTYSAIESDNICDVVSESYGWLTSSVRRSTRSYNGATFTSAYNIHLAMTAQGITYMAATGDDGTLAWPTTGNTFGYPGIDPTVLNVGGSEVTSDATTNAFVSEASWGLASKVGGTGGFDPWDTPAHGFAFNAVPSYQSSYLSSSITSTYPYREIPDISSVAGGQDGLGQESPPYADWAIVIFYNNPPTYPLGTQTEVDGTSLASPATAGSIIAMNTELFFHVTPNATRSNVRIGELQPFLYAHGSNASMVYDITLGNSIGNLPTTSIPAPPTAGWDFATGWGSFLMGGLYNALVAAGV